MNKYPVYKDKKDNLYLVDEKKGYGIRLWSKDKFSMFKLEKKYLLEKTSHRLQIKIPPLTLFPSPDFEGYDTEACNRVYDNFKDKIYTENDPYMFSLGNKIYTHSEGTRRLFSIDLTKSRVIIRGMFEDTYFQYFREDGSGEYNPYRVLSKNTPINSDKCFFDSRGIFQTTDFKHKKIIGI